MQPKLSKTTLELIGRYQKEFGDYIRAKHDGLHMYSRTTPDKRVVENLEQARTRLCDLKRAMWLAIEDDRERP